MIKDVEKILLNQRVLDYSATSKYLTERFFNKKFDYKKEETPTVYLVIGGVSSGKSTFSYNLLKNLDHKNIPYLGNDTAFVINYKGKYNVDEGYKKARNDVYAAINVLLEMRVSFVWETVLSKEKKIDTIKSIKKAGYRIICFFMVSHLSNSLQRYHEAEKNNGYAIDESFVEDRYYKVFRYFNSAQSLFNEIYIIENDKKMSLVYARDSNSVFFVDNPPVWIKNINL